MAQIVIRKLDDAVIARHRERARLAGRSLEQELRDVIARAAHRTPSEKVAVAAEIRALTRKVKRPSVEDIVRQDRDSR